MRIKKHFHIYIRELGTMISLYSFVALLGVIVFFPISSNAYSYAGMKWTSGHPDYWLDIAGWDQTLIISPAIEWRNVSPSPFYFNYRGHTIYGFGDGKNDITRYPHSGGIATTWTWNSGNSIAENDTVFNMNYGWGCCGESNLYDVRNTMTHEFGHWLKLNDLYGPLDILKTMFFSAFPGETMKRSLTTDDANGMNYIYP